MGVEYDIRKVGFRVRPSSSTEYAPQLWRLIGKHALADDWQHIAFLTDKTGGAAWTSNEYYEETVTPYGDPSTKPGYRYLKFSVTVRNGAFGPYCGTMYLRETAAGPNRGPWYKTVTATGNIASNFNGACSFDLNNSNGCYSDHYPGTINMVLDYGTGYKFDPYEFGVASADQPTIMWNTYTIEGSNDASAWDLLLTKSGDAAWSFPETRTYASLL